jgi:hypothetical protein
MNPSIPMTLSASIVGLVMLLGLVALARRYWFVTPLAGTSLSLLLYAVSIALAWAG